MSIRSTLLGAAALYALGRMTHDLDMGDVRQYASTLSGIDGDDITKFALDNVDDLLLKAGLRRAAAVPSSTLLVLGGVGAGVVLGAGLAFYLMSDSDGSRASATATERSTNGSETSAGTA